MVNNNEQYFKQVINKYRALMLRSRDAVGIIAVELFTESFTTKSQNMGNGRFVKWPNRGFAPPSEQDRGLLVKRGRLRRGTKYSKFGSTSVMIQNDTPYASLQNEGGKIKVTAKMRRFFWAMVYKHWQKRVTYDVSTKQLSGNKQSQKFGAEAEFWFKMAMAKEIEVKARPFIYDTPELPARMDKYFLKQIENIVKP